jgi:phosphocarrier protein HPr
VAESRVIVGSRIGLHARPAAAVAEMAAKQPVPVSIGKPGGSMVNAASVLMLMSLGAKAGDEVVISADSEAAVAAVGAVVAADLDSADQPEQPSNA